MQKQKAKITKNCKTLRTESKGLGKSIRRKKTRAALLKSSPAKLAQLNNYKAFLKYLISGKTESKITDEC